MSTAPADADARPLERWAIRLVGLGLTTIVAVTFVTSFDAVSAVAATRGAVSPHLAWAIPLAIDGLIVVGSAAAWLESLRGGRWHPFPVTLVAVAGGLSVAANVAHAPGTDPLARALAAVPPVALLSAVELGAWLMRRQVRRTAVTAQAVAADTNGHKRLTMDELRIRIPTQDDYERLLTEHGSLRAAAAALAVHPSSLSRRRDELGE